MAVINHKLETIIRALDTLKDSITLFNQYAKIASETHSAQDEKLFLGLRDSMIQRFEYCTDLFWKVLKIYLEEIEKVSIPTISPKGIIREAVKIRLITEVQGQDCITMVDNRNQTSHIYHEEVAEKIANKVPEYYQLMVIIIKKIEERIK